MSLVWKYRIGKTWYLDYAKHLCRPRRSIHIKDERRAELLRITEENKILFEDEHSKYRPVQDVHFSDAASLYLDRKRGDGKAPNTIESYTAALDNFGIFLQVDEYVHKIKAEKIEGYKLHRFNVKGRRKKVASPKTLRNELGVLRNFFRWAMKQSYTRDNPMEGIEFPRRVRQSPRFLKEDQYPVLMKVIESAVWRNVIDFYILTGAREEEGTRILISRDVDLTRKVIQIPMSKTANFKVLPISADLLAVLKRLIRDAKERGADKLIPFTPDALNRGFKRFVAKAELPAQLTWHSLRHTAGTWLGSKGVGLKEIQQFMGHSDPQSSLIYMHLNNPEMKPTVDKLHLPKRKSGSNLKITSSRSRTA